MTYYSIHKHMYVVDIPVVSCNTKKYQSKYISYENTFIQQHFEENLCSSAFPVLQKFLNNQVKHRLFSNRIFVCRSNDYTAAFCG